MVVLFSMRLGTKDLSMMAQFPSRVQTLKSCRASWIMISKNDVEAYSSISGPEKFFLKLRSPPVKESDQR